MNDSSGDVCRVIDDVDHSNVNVGRAIASYKEAIIENTKEIVFISKDIAVAVQSDGNDSASLHIFKQGNVH